MTAVQEVFTKALDTLRNTNTQNIIFQTDQPSQMEEVAGGQSAPQQTQGRQGAQDTPPGNNLPIKPKDFYWDQVVVILVSAILGLTFLDIAVEFFRGSGVQCYTPTVTGKNMSEDFTRDQASFVNNYCYQSLPSSEYFPLFILAQGLAIIAPHYLWSALFGPHFDFFFDLAKDLKRLRDIKTGEYDPKNFEIVKKLEKEYKKHTIFYSYIFKLALQLLFAVFSFFFATTYFDDFSSTFNCPRHGAADNDWPLDFTITCVYISLRFLSIIRYLDVLLVVLAGLAIIVGLVWCCLRHTAELGHKCIANFVVNSCLLVENYVPKHFWIYPFTPRVQNDLDFLLMRLFRTDTGHGQVFKDIQVQKQVDLLTKQDHELLQLFLSAEIEMDKNDDSEARIHDVHMAFKAAGFKGTPRDDVYRRFSPQFGITARKLCEEPLAKIEIQKVAEEVAHEGTGKVEELAKLLGVNDERLEEIRPLTNVTELQEKIFDLLQEWLRSKEGNGVPEQATIPEAQTSTQASPTPRRLLVRYLHRIGMKLTGEGILYGEFLNLAPIDVFRNRIHGFVQFTPHNSFATDISFGSTGCGYMLAWAFEEVASINFDPYLQDEESVVKVDTFFSNVVTMRFPTDIFVQRTDNVIKFGEAVELPFYGEGELAVDRKERNAPMVFVDFIIVGPIDDEAKRVTVTLLIDKLHTDRVVARKAVLLALRPLQIADKDTEHKFIKYVPPPSLFQRICVPGDEETPEDDAHKKLRHQIAKESIIPIKDTKTGKIETEGIVATCGDVPCVFEFSVYQYTKARGAGKKSTVSGSQEKRQKQMKDKNRHPQQRQTMPAVDNRGVRLPVTGVLDLRLPQERKIDNREVEERNATGPVYPIAPLGETSGLRHRTVTQGNAAGGAPPAKPKASGKQTTSRLNSETATIPDREPESLPPIEPEPLTEEDEYCFKLAMGNMRVGGKPPAIPQDQHSADDDESDTDYKSLKSVPSIEASEHDGSGEATSTAVNKQNLATTDSPHSQEQTVINGLDHHHPKGDVGCEVNVDTEI